MNKKYTDEMINLAKELSKKYDYIPAVHELIKRTDLNYKEAEKILSYIQEGRNKNGD